jgi:hypothetical protein
MGGLAKQGAAEGINTHQLAPKRHKVEVGLQNLVFAPTPVEHLGGHRLAELLRHAAPTGPLAQVGCVRAVEQARQLHGQGAGTARALVPQIAPSGGRGGAPVHPAVLVKALVFRQHHGGAQRRRHLGQRHPGPAPHLGIGAHTLQHLAFAREQHGFRRLEAPAYFVKRGQGPGQAGTHRQAHQPRPTPGRALPPPGTVCRGSVRNNQAQKAVEHGAAA